MADINSSKNVRAMLTQVQDRRRKPSAGYFDLLERGLSTTPGDATLWCIEVARPCEPPVPAVIRAVDHRMQTTMEIS